jgi:hypothetical protein
MSRGYGYELTALDAREAHRHAVEAGRRIGQEARVALEVERLLASEGAGPSWLRRVLGVNEPRRAVR